MMESIYTTIIFALLVAVVALPYWWKVARHRREASEKFQKSKKMGIHLPVTLHPQFDLTNCIGCASCVRACPEHVLGIVDGKPAILNGTKCVGHALCADVCPVGAVTMGFGTPRRGMEIPHYDHNHETNVRGLYIIGELSGVGLIKNAVAHGVEAVGHAASQSLKRRDDELDVLIVGAGPAGLSAALAAEARKLRYIVLDQDEIGGTILHYPRQKLVLTSPVELPLYGRLKASEISKEELLGIWQGIVNRFNLRIASGQKVESVEKVGDHCVVRTSAAEFRSQNVMLALGRRGSPRKLGVKGENLQKVMYRLMEAERYKNANVLVVGGGDSAVEAAMGLASQTGNVVTVSYRKEEFIRLKEKNERKIRQFIDAEKIRVLFTSEVCEIRGESVVIQEGGTIVHNLPNHFVFIFAGGELPGELLKRSGIKLRTADVEEAAALAT